MSVLAVALVACSGSSEGTSALEPGPEARTEGGAEESAEADGDDADRNEEAPADREEGRETVEAPTEGAPAAEAADETPELGDDDDPSSPVARIAAWRAALPAHCQRFVRGLEHDSRRFAVATVWEGTGVAGGDEVCPNHSASGVVASWTGTAPLNLSCMSEPGELGDVDDDSRLDLLFVEMGCAQSPPDFVTVYRDTEAGPVLVPLPEGVSPEVRRATLFPRDDGSVGIELVPFDWDTADEYPPPEVDPVRLVWRDGRLVRLTPAEQ